MQGHPRWMSHSSVLTKHGQLEEGNGTPLQCSCCKNATNIMKRQKDVTSKDEPPRLEGVQYATGEEQRAITNSPRKNEVTGPKQKQCSVVEVSGGERNNAVKNNIA